MALIVICIVLIVVAAIFGTVNFITRLAGGSPTRAIGYVHGAVATVSLLLVVISIRHSTAGPDWAFRLLVVAALAGFILFGIDLATKKAPTWLGFHHGAVALAGFVFLLIFAFAGARAV